MYIRARPMKNKPSEAHLPLLQYMGIIQKRKGSQSRNKR